MTEKINQYENVPWRFYFIEGFAEDTSYLLCLAHHSFIDGIQMLGNLLLTNDTKIEMKNVAGIPYWKIVLGQFVAPLYAIKVALKQFLITKDVNCFKKAPP